MGSITRLINLPPAVKAAIFLGSGGSLGAMLYMLPIPNEFAFIVWGLTAVITLVYGGLKLVFKGMDKQKSKPFEQKLAENASAAPSGVSDPARRARLDDLRKKFQEGISTYKDHGKDLYSVPWYVIVGEPGSGKTEAIRHSSVGFPPGLQDQLQGSGGTLNMNWWFTQHAVIIDTAGRLMFEEVAPGTTSEWNEFLQLLKKTRPNCPMNGMLLVIPADTLIKDTAGEIEAKAGKIAQQLDQIQRLVGVRFPVYVLVTKCDLINGFREFFDDLDDPVMSHQMLGWSNPNPLDVAFDPQQVSDHLDTVKRRLFERRLGLMIDPVHSENDAGRRIDEVDALYAFPDALTKIAPRLQVYLQMIFTQGEWSSKPLFLRGIYFTSSMREGAELDADLAETFGVDIESLPDGGLVSVDRAYFLRDLFTSKVFREKGLVTRAANVKGQKTSRKLILMGAAAFGILMVGVMTVIGFLQLNDSMRRPAQYWSQAADFFTDKNEASGEGEFVDLNKIVFDDYDGLATIFQYQNEDTPVTFAERHEGAISDIQAGGRVSPVFSVFAMVSDPLKKRDLAQQYMFEGVVIDPLVRESIAALGNEAMPWDTTATSALQEILKLSSDERPPETNRVRLAPLLSYIDAAQGEARTQGFTDGMQVAAGEMQRLQAVFNWTYYGDEFGNGGKAEWPPRLLGVQTPTYRDQVLPAVERFVRHWSADTSATQPDDGAGSLLSRLNLIVAASRTFADAERELLALPSFDDVETSDAYEFASEAWQDQFAELQTAHTELDALLTALDADYGQLSRDDLLDVAEQESVSQAREEYALLLDAIEEGLSSSLGSTEQSSLLGSAGQSFGTLRSQGESAMAAATPELPVDGEGESEGEGEGAGLASNEGPDDGQDTSEDDTRASRSLTRAATRRLLAGFEALRATAGDQLASLEGELAAFGPGMLDRIASRDDGSRFLSERFALYEAVNTELTFTIDPDDVDVARLGELIEQLQRDRVDTGDMVDGHIRVVRGTSSVQSLEEFATRASSLTRRALDAAFSWRGTQYVLIGIDQIGTSDSDIESWVADAVVRDDDLAPPETPEIMGTEFADGFEYDYEYAPLAAKSVFELQKQIEQLLIGQRGDADEGDALIQVLDRQEIEDSVADLGDAVAEYAETYLEYWVQTVGRDFVAPEPVSDSEGGDRWTAARQFAKDLSHRRVLNGLEDLAEHMTEALTVVRDHGSEDLADEAQSYLAGIEEGLELYADTSNRGPIRSTLKEWEDLKASASDARGEILSLRPDEFHEFYLNEMDAEQLPEGSPHAVYWSELYLSFLANLKDSALGAASRAIAQIKNNASGFPIAIDSPVMLSPETVQNAQFWIADARARGNDDGGNEMDDRGWGDEEMGNADVTLSSLDKTAQGFIRELRGETGRRSAEENEAVLTKIDSVLRAFSTRDEPMEFEIMLLPTSFHVQSGKPGIGGSGARQRAIEAYLAVEVLYNDLALPAVGRDRSARILETRADEPIVINRSFDLYNADPSALKIRFSQFNPEAGDPGAQHERAIFRTPWTALEAVKQGDASKIDPSFVAGEDTTIWGISIEVPNPTAGQQSVNYWLGLKLSRELPSPASWPTTADIERLR